MFAPPLKSSRKRAAKLSLTPLESRDVPATWTLQLLSPTAGDPGDTEATHTGGLYLQVDSIEAASATAAVQAALTGAVQVQSGSFSHEYGFPDAAYRLTPGIGTVLVEFEDLAAAPVCDWDFNDRSWLVRARQQNTFSPPPPPQGNPSIGITTTDGVEGSQAGRFTITRYDSDLSEPLPFTFSLGGSLIEGEDYSSQEWMGTIDVGEASADVVIQNWDNTIADGDDSVTLTLDPIDGYEMPAEPTVTIAVAEPIPGVLPTIFPPPLPGKIGNYVWLDADEDGMQDATESGIPGVTVYLYAAPAGYLGDLLQTTVTDADGFYQFANVEPGAFHKLQFVNPDESIFDFTYWNVEATGLIDSDVYFTDPNSPSYGFTEAFAVQPGETNNTMDAGFVSSAVLGDALVEGRVWDDQSQNGIQDYSEVGIADEVVKLVRPNGDIVRTTTTNAEGHYAFTLVPAGEYAVQFAVPDGMPYTDFSPANVGDDDEIDSDADIVTGRSEVFFANDNQPKAVDGGKRDENGIQVIISDSTGLETNNLRVGKWENAFKVYNEEDLDLYHPTLAEPLDFIDKDVDRFNIWVRDLAKWNEGVAQGAAINTHLHVNISTTNIRGFTEYNDNANEIDLVRVESGILGKGDGWYWSDSQLLVSNVIDDEKYAGAVLENNTVGWYLTVDERNAQAGIDAIPKHGRTWQLSDRTHKVALNGTVKAEYKVGNSVFPAEKPVKPDKIVNLHINVVRKSVGGQPSTSEFLVKRDIKSAQEIYAQAGVFIPTPQIHVVDPPNGVDLSDGFSIFSWNPFTQSHWPSTETDALLSKSEYRTPTVQGKFDVVAYYVNELNALLPSIPMGEGYSYCGSDYPTYPYIDSVVVAHDRDFLTLAHEVGHVLTDDGHYWICDEVDDLLDTVNLMVEGERSVAAREFRDSRRIIQYQAQRMISQRPHLLNDPK